MANYEVATLLSLRDLATAPLQRFIALLKDAQAQLDRTMGAVKLLQDAQAPGAAMLAMQRESLGLTQKEATLRAGIAADMTKQSEAMVAANKESLLLAKQQLDVQRAIGATSGARFVGAANKAGNKLLWGGVGIVGGLAYATQKAIDFDQTTLQTDMALGGFRRTAAQRTQDMAALQDAAFKGSQATGFFTAQGIMEGLQKAASSGMRPLVDKMGMGVFTQIVPTLAQYMDVLGRLKGETADTAALEAMQLVHMFGSYTPSAINKTLNGVAMLSLLMPDTMGKAISALSYVAPTGIQLAGLDVSDIAAFVATADQSGLGRGRSGARLKDYIEAIAVTQSKAREHAKTTLGIRGAIGKDGELDLAKSFAILIADKNRMAPQAFRDAVRSAFGAQGDVVAAMFGDKSKTGMFQANRAAIQGSIDRGDLATVQNILKGGAQGREAAAWATLQNDIVKFGHIGIPIAIKFFDTINPRLQQFGAWMSQHPDDAKRFFDNLLKVGEGMLIVGGAFKIIAGLANAVTVVRGIAGGFKTISSLLKAGKVTRDVASGIEAIDAAAPGTAAAGLTSFAGALGLVGTAASFWYGIFSEMNYDAKHPKSAKLAAWAASGANQGLPAPPGSFPHDVDMFGRPIHPATPTHSSAGHGASGSRGSVTQHVHIDKVSFVLPRGSDASNARRIMQHIASLVGAVHTASGWNIAPGSFNGVPVTS